MANRTSIVRIATLKTGTMPAWQCMINIMMQMTLSSLLRRARIPAWQTTLLHLPSRPRMRGVAPARPVASALLRRLPSGMPLPPLVVPRRLPPHSQRWSPGIPRAAWIDLPDTFSPDRRESRAVTNGLACPFAFPSVSHEPRAYAPVSSISIDFEKYHDVKAMVCPWDAGVVAACRHCAAGFVARVAAAGSAGSKRSRACAVVCIGLQGLPGRGR